MGIFDLFQRKEKVKQTAVSKENVGEDIKKSAESAKSKKKSDKDLATERGEPYISVTSVELDPSNIGNGAFELDWNDKFITNLVRAGYQQKPNEEESVIVDRWFQDVCRNILQENHEQWEANYSTARRIDSQDLGDGKTSIS